MANVEMTALLASLGDGITPAYVAHVEIEAALFKIYDLADDSHGRSQALALMASAAVDQTELRLDKPPAVEGRMAEARATLIKFLQTTGARVFAGEADDDNIRAMTALIRAIKMHRELAETVRTHKQVLCTQAARKQISGRFAALCHGPRSGMRLAVPNEAEIHESLPDVVIAR